MSLNVKNALFQNILKNRMDASHANTTFALLATRTVKETNFTTLTLSRSIKTDQNFSAKNANASSQKVAFGRVQNTKKTVIICAKIMLASNIGLTSGL
jgi:hypothetical protein